MSNIVSGISFPAIRGIQAGNEYYIVMCPLKRLRRVFTFDESNLAVEDRAQRTLKMERIPEITNYILSERDNYVFSAITACIEGKSLFTPIGDADHEEKIGSLMIDADAEVYITDGQHRNAAINNALQQDPTLANETISVVFFADKTLENRQKIFKDLNLYPVKTDRSLSITYDDKPASKLSKAVIASNTKLAKLVHMEDSNLSQRSKKLITHSAFNKATSQLFDEITESNYQKLTPIASEFWKHLIDNLPDWNFVYEDKVSSCDIRKDSIQAHSVTLQALGIVGRALLNNDSDWKNSLLKLKDINWDKSNKQDWGNRCITNGSMRNTSVTVRLTANKIKQYLQIPLTNKEQAEESKLNGTFNGN